MSTEHCTVHYYSHIWALSLDLETLSFPGKLELRGKCCVILRCQSLAGLFNSNGSIICSLVFRFWANPKFWFVSISSLVQGERCCEYWMHTQYRFWSNPKFWSVSTYLTSGQGREQRWICTHSTGFKQTLSFDLLVSHLWSRESAAVNMHTQYRFWANPKFWSVSFSPLVKGERCCEYAHTVQVLSKP